MNVMAQAGAVSEYVELAASIPTLRHFEASHLDRIQAVVKAARIFADALAAKFKIPLEAVEGLTAATRRLAIDLSDKSGNLSLLAEDDFLSALEEEHGSMPAALFGIATLIEQASGIERDIDALPEADENWRHRLVRVSRADYQAVLKGFVPLLGEIEGAITSEDTPDLYLREIWSVLVMSNVTITQLSDAAGIDPKSTASALSAAAKALANAYNFAMNAQISRSIDVITGLMSALDQAQQLIERAVAAQSKDLVIIALRQLSRGRLDLDEKVVVELVQANKDANISVPRALKAAEALRAEWGSEHAA